MEQKYPINNPVQKGTRIVGQVRITPILNTMIDRGMKRIDGGTR